MALVLRDGADVAIESVRERVSLALIRITHKLSVDSQCLSWSLSEETRGSHYSQRRILDVLPTS